VITPNGSRCCHGRLQWDFRAGCEFGAALLVPVDDDLLPIAQSRRSKSGGRATSRLSLARCQCLLMQPFKGSS